MRRAGLPCERLDAELGEAMAAGTAVGDVLPELERRRTRRHIRLRPVDGSAPHAHDVRG